MSVSLIKPIYKLDPARYATQEYLCLYSGSDLLPSPFLETQETIKTHSSSQFSLLAMAASVVCIADLVTVKRCPLDGDIEVIVGRAKSLRNAVYVAFPGTWLAAAVLGGVFFTSDDVSTTDPGGAAIPNPTIKAWGASPDGRGSLIELDANLRTLLEAYSLPLTELEIPLRSVGSTTAYARGSDPRIGKEPNDSMQYGRVLDLRVGVAGGDREASTLQEFPILEALSILGSVAREFQGPDEIAKSAEFQRGHPTSSARLTTARSRRTPSHGPWTSPLCLTSTHLGASRPTRWVERMTLR